MNGKRLYKLRLFLIEGHMLPNIQYYVSQRKALLFFRVALHSQ